MPGLALIETRGHVPGHQSVLVRLPKTGAVLLTIDAVPFGQGFTRDEQDDGSNPDAEAIRARDRADFRHSLARSRRLMHKALAGHVGN